MHIVYPYNEILPTRRAHDVYIFQECAAFAEAGIKVTLLIGQGSLSDEELCSHYLQKPKPSLLSIIRLPIVRKNNVLNLSWNRIFFYFARKTIAEIAPDYVILSVFKLASYLIQYREPAVRYLYEVHELCYYPGIPLTEDVYKEAELLSKMDLVITTTEALKQILEADPYSLKTTCKAISLSVDHKPLPDIKADIPLRVCYVGQLYKQQGITMLLQALSQTEQVHLKVIGGTKQEIDDLKKIAFHLEIEQRVHFLGFLSPSQLEKNILDTHLFIAPFENQGKMPYVAHTKLLSYSTWKRPFIVPYSPSVMEYFDQSDATLFYQEQDPSSLAQVLQKVSDQKTLECLLEKARHSNKNFSWNHRVYLYHKVLMSQSDGL